MSIEHLKIFCGDEGRRPYLLKPQTDGEWVYATNGFTAVRIPFSYGFDPLDDKIKALTGWFDDPREEAPLSKLLIPARQVDDCSMCSDGYVNDCGCPNCDGHECEDCEGKGEIEVRDVVEVNDAYLVRGEVLRLIGRLPDPTIALSKNDRGHVSFGSGNLRGIFLPVTDRPDTRRDRTKIWVEPAQLANT